MTAWSAPRYVVVDVEGNGQRPPDLVELAVVPIAAGVIGEPTSWLCRPDKPITAMAKRIHGITDEMVADAVVFASVEADIRGRLDDAVLVGCPHLATQAREAPSVHTGQGDLGRAMRHCSDGMLISIDGPSGVGKTTTVRALAQLLANEGQDHPTARSASSPASPPKQFTVWP